MVLWLDALARILTSQPLPRGKKSSRKKGKKKR
jgi:hypothetical protein